MNQTALIRDIWNEMIATPKNKKGSFQLQPKYLQDIVYRHLGKPQKEVRYKPFKVNQTYQIKWATGGYSDTIIQAIEIHKTAKEQYIKEVADKWKDKIDPRVYEALINYNYDSR